MFLDQQRAVCFHPRRPASRVPLDFCFWAKGQCRHIVNLKSAFIMVRIRPKAHLNNSFSASMNEDDTVYSVVLQNCCTHQSYPSGLKLGGYFIEFLCFSHLQTSCLIRSHWLCVRCETEHGTAILKLRHTSSLPSECTEWQAVTLDIQ